ncbi:hypothetical protein [Vibrio sp. OPT18]|uniref:hypothetical protein n=1 Tax=Vibrio sp. OPT18 TaxID=2778641 RepID=UPI00187F9FDE|nr:hypothetical protein [Vibrio sp. OPT18]MBE8574148.1 hypothetical protein [Vibrio sp. OPT18]
MAKRSLNVKEVPQPALKEQSGNEVFNMTLRNVPSSARETFRELKALGKVSGSMNSYIVNAFLRQVQQDEK